MQAASSARDTPFQCSKKSGATKEEIDEVVAIAMTLGASKIKIEAMEAEEAVEENPDVECPICGISDTGEKTCGGG